MFVLRTVLIIAASCASVVPTVAQDKVDAHSNVSPRVGEDGSHILSYKYVVRFQAIALPKPASAMGDRLMVLDTQTGDVWQWWDNVAQHVGRTGITYMGRLKPGAKPGETITYQRFDAPKKPTADSSR